MNIGDYVRTKKGIIGKIKAIDNQTDLEDLYLVKRKWYYKEDIIKSSPNIIRLLKEGDYINGYPIQFTLNDKEVIYNENHPHTLNCLAKDIKSIVTKEQFESIEYKVGE